MDIKVFHLPTDVTGDNAGQLKHQIDELTAGEPCLLLLDMAAVSYMNTAGLNALIHAYNRARGTGGRVRLHQPQPHVRQMLSISRFDRILDVSDDPAGPPA